MYNVVIYNKNYSHITVQLHTPHYRAKIKIVSNMWKVRAVGTRNLHAHTDDDVGSNTKRTESNRLTPISFMHDDNSSNGKIIIILLFGPRGDANLMHFQ
jgi:hypothetical protein